MAPYLAYSTQSQFEARTSFFNICIHTPLPAPNCPVDITNFKRDPFATCLWSNYGIPLNRFQCSAMELALKRRFQLIQGPPGICICEYICSASCLHLRTCKCRWQHHSHGVATDEMQLVVYNFLAVLSLYIRMFNMQALEKARRGPTLHTLLQWVTKSCHLKAVSCTVVLPTRQ